MTEKQEPTEWTIAIDGERIANLPEEKRYVDVDEPSPAYRVDEDATNPEKSKTKLIVNTVMHDGKKAQWYPNRTSARFIAKKLDTDLSAEGMKKWVGARIYFGKVMDQMIGGQEKKVIYATEVDFPKNE